MSISLAQQSVGAASASTTALATSFSTPTTSGNGVVVCVGSTIQDASSVTDTAGNVYNKIVTANFFGAPFTSIWSCNNVTGGFTAVTANFASNALGRVVASEVLGTLTTDVSNGHFANSTNGTPGAITTTGANRIVFVSIQDNAITSQPSGYTDLYGVGAGLSFDAAYNVYTSIQTGLNPNWINAIGGYAAVIVAFGSSNTGQPPPLLPPPPRRKTFLAGPWPFGLPVTPTNSAAPPALPAHDPVPPVMPPVPSLLPLSLRMGLFRRAPVTPMPTPPAPPVPVPPTPPGPGRGKAKPFFRPLTFADDMRRIREIHEQISVCLNALVAKGMLVKTGESDWELRSGSRVLARDPAATDDVTQSIIVGQLWVNSASHAKFICVSNAMNAAVWVAF